MSLNFLPLESTTTLYGHSNLRWTLGQFREHLINGLELLAPPSAFFSNRTAALAQICFQRYFADDFELDKNKRCAQSVILLWLQLNEMFLAGEWVFAEGSEQCGLQWAVFMTCCCWVIRQQFICLRWNNLITSCRALLTSMTDTQ